MRPTPPAVPAAPVPSRRRPAPALAGALALSGLLAAASAAAQEPPPRLDATSTSVVSSSRVLGLAGAYVGIAEGLDGAAANPAAVAQRDRHLDRGWDWDFSLNWIIGAPGKFSSQDLDNNGRPLPDYESRANLEAGLMGQVGRLGLGVLGRTIALGGKDAAGNTAKITYSDAGVYLGWAFREEQLLVGAGLMTMSGQVDVGIPALGLQERRTYRGTRSKLGLLLRPQGRAWRIGASLDPGASAHPSNPPIVVATPEAISFPTVFALGFATWIGAEADRHNQPSPAARRQLGLAEPPPLPEGVAEPLLLTLQVEVQGRTPGAIGREDWLYSPPGSTPVPSGAATTFVARVGAEKELLPHRLAVRGGSYLEPSRTGAPVRVHGTLGADLRVRLLWDWRVGFSVDAAERYLNGGLSLGFWHDHGPQPTPPPP